MYPAGWIARLDAGRATDEPVFTYYDTGIGKSSSIRVNGQPHSLRFIKSNGNREIVEVWKDDYLIVVFRYHEMKLEYESFKFKGTLTISIGKHRKTYSIEGVTGC